MAGSDSSIGLRKVRVSVSLLVVQDVVNPTIGLVHQGGEQGHSWIKSDIGAGSWS